jgi:hypothetical protein
LYPKGFLEALDFPNDYLDYEPSFPVGQHLSSQRMAAPYSSYCLRAPSWLEAETDYNTNPTSHQRAPPQSELGRTVKQSIEGHSQTERISLRNEEAQAESEESIHPKEEREAQTERIQTENRGSATEALVSPEKQSPQQQFPTRNSL